jgi:NAD(P)H-quinone oxidoreductase subunit 5
MSYIMLFLIAFPLLVYGFHKKGQLTNTPFIYVGACVAVLLTAISFSHHAPFIINFNLLSVPGFIEDFSLTLVLDTLSGVVASSVLTIGAVVFRFSCDYLKDDPKRESFLKNLSLMLTSILIMVFSHNFIIYWLSWFLTSYFLHQLLIHFNHLLTAQKAANQKFWVSRLGDIFLLSAILLMGFTFNSVDFATIFTQIDQQDFLINNRMAVMSIGFLIILGALTKSAQFPFHFWLPNTMDSPTPVSAIMHAGILNAGGYLVIRLSPLLSKTPLVLSLLVIVGLITLVYAVLKMLTQTDIKKKLAYSTISQMAFMMIQCGVGAFALATLHIIAHAFYKSYAFLSSGTATDSGKMNRYTVGEKSLVSLWTIFFVGGAALLLIFGSALIIRDYSDGTVFQASLIFILALALAQIFISRQNKVKSFVEVLKIGTLYGLLSYIFTSLLTPYIGTVENFGILEKSLFVCIALIFLALYFIQKVLPQLNQTRFGQALYVKLYMGGRFGNS